ncbi:MAG: NFACT RNA binding domain-containing protein [Lentisphaeria bacterium]|jgi:predicted ribosome quality control (RQC) complex YloA/Tae2 family protein
MRKSQFNSDAMPEPRCWSYELDDGWLVRAGKTDDDNDLLSLRCAHPKDWWFHVHAMPGSHVVLSHSDKDKAPDAALIRTAAAIAAWHSKARDGGNCPVSYTQARNVSKPRAAKPGTVTISKEKIIRVKPSLPQDGTA